MNMDSRLINTMHRTQYAHWVKSVVHTLFLCNGHDAHVLDFTLEIHDSGGQISLTPSLLHNFSLRRGIFALEGFDGVQRTACK